MVGKTFTYLVGSEAGALFFNSKNDDLNAEEVYSRLTTPVFGKGVAYDVPNPVSKSEYIPQNMQAAWWRHQMEAFSALLGPCEGNPGESPPERPVMRSFDVFFDLRLNIRLSKQSRR